MDKKLLPTNMTDWLGAVKLSDTPLVELIGKGAGDKRMTDEPPPEKPAWLVRRREIERRERDALQVMRDPGEYFDDDPVEALIALGYTITITPPEGGILPPMTDDQEAEREEYAQAYLEWNRRNPVIEKPKRNLAWGFSR